MGRAGATRQGRIRVSAAAAMALPAPLLPGGPEKRAESQVKPPRRANGREQQAVDNAGAVRGDQQSASAYGQKAEQPTGHSLSGVQELAQAPSGICQGQQEPSPLAKRVFATFDRERIVSHGDGERRNHQQQDDRYGARGATRQRAGLPQPREALQLSELARWAHATKWTARSGTARVAAAACVPAEKGIITAL